MKKKAKEANLKKETPEVKAGKRVVGKKSLPGVVKSVSVKTPEPIEPAPQIKIKNKYTRRFFLMVASSLLVLAGLGVFSFYVGNRNMLFGLISIALIVGGVLSIRYFWKQGESFTVKHIDGQQPDEKDVNSLCIYEDRIVFENVYEPRGFPQRCLNLKKDYFVNIMNPETTKLEPFILPDQQYYDPDVFAQRVLGLPAHRKIFERKPKLLQKLKTAFLVLAIAILWLLILTTTGGGD